MVARAVLVDPGLVLAPATEPDGVVGKVLEAVLDVGGENLSVEAVERWLGGVVVEGLTREENTSRRCRARFASGSDSTASCLSGGRTTGSYK